MSRHEVKDTHRGLYCEDGVLTSVLGAGRHMIPRHIDLGFYRRPRHRWCSSTSASAT